jgi:streptomycin 6-kinase
MGLGMIHIPDTLRKNILETFHEQGAAWLERLPDLIHEFAARWSLQLSGPFLLSYSYCAPAVQAGGREVVLKLAVPGDEFTQHTLALQAFDGRGMVRVIEADFERGALLMERLLPGRMLVDEVRDDEEATRIAARVMRAIRIPVPDGPTFPSMADWAGQFSGIRTHFQDRHCPLPARTIDRTERLFKELLDTEGTQHLLHGDLHHFNILSVSEESELGWRAIDPFGVVGEREVEVGAFVKNPDLAIPFTTEVERKLLRRLDVFHEQLGLDLQRMAAWSSVYAAVSAWWTISTGADGWQVDAVLSDFFARSLS